MSAEGPLPHESVFVAALGSDAERLHPKVRRYAKGPGVGQTAVAEGTFEVAGSRFRWLNHLLRPFVGPELLVTRYERNVPFMTVARNQASPGNDVGLQTERSFVFRNGPQRFVDVLHRAPTPGTLRNFLGRDRRIELQLRCEVTSEGWLCLRSERAWIHMGSLRFPLPALMSVRVEVNDGYDESSGRQTIDARVRSPILGTVLEYRGKFLYRVEGQTLDRANCDSFQNE